MSRKTKDRAGGHQATLKTSSKRNSASIASRIKAAIVTLAVWGWFPIGLADWINRGRRRGCS